MGEPKSPESEQEKAKVPFAPRSVASDEAEVKVKVPKPLYRRRPCQICCGVSTVVLVVVLIVIFVLSFTEFKTKDPRIEVTGMTLKSFSATVDSTLTALKLDVSLHLAVSVRNPNIASFKYDNSSTYLYYRGREVGSAAIPAGRVAAKKTERFETDLDILSLRVVLDANLTSDLQAGIIPVSTYSAIRGNLNVINVFKHHAVSTSDCSASIVVANTTLKDFKCIYSIKL